MGVIERLNIRESIIYGTGFYSGDFDQEMHLKRAVGEPCELPKYYFGVYSNINGRLTQQGYLYFYLDKEKKTSYFIGAKVEDEYRDLNIGSFLVATWINFCLNNGYENLGVNKKQRKPFLLFLLKKYGFDVPDITQYYLRNDIVTICCDVEYADKSKFLLFKDGREEERFIKTNTFKEDNYEIIHLTRRNMLPHVGDVLMCDRDIRVALLDEIIFPIENIHKNPADYQLINYKEAEGKVARTLRRHTR